MRAIKAITVKRCHINLQARDAYGHWWFEIEGIESYGWYPKYKPTLLETFIGVEGELNGITTFNGQPTEDPHQGDPADEVFHPVVDSGDVRTEGEIMDCLRRFATTYSGKWQWFFGLGQNCHTFQEAAMKHCKMRAP
jgi:hypothetical protein